MLPEHYTPPQSPVQVQPKSPGLAILLSFLLPGLGSMYASRAGRGALILGLYLLSWVLTLILIGFLGVFGCWIWGMVAGYGDAIAWNLQRGIES
jgi:TM2 domain-containing membrane protein YozV